MPLPSHEPSRVPWLSRVATWTVDRLARVRPTAIYAFGKHPAFADFIDVAALPPVPASFRPVHDELRPALERDGGPAEPVLIAWRGRGGSAVLWVHPSRDLGDVVTGAHRRCPLLLGMTARGSLRRLLRFAGHRLPGLADAVMVDGADAALARIAAASAEWPAAFDGGAGSPDPVGLAAAAMAGGGAGVRVLIAGTHGVISDARDIDGVPLAICAEWVRLVGVRRAPPE